MPTEAARRCDKCEWWVKLKDEEDNGQCRRLPPTVVATEKADGNFMARWPRVYDTHWCGEFRLRDDATIRDAVSFARAGLLEPRP